jgi:hypothetical protein
VYLWNRDACRRAVFGRYYHGSDRQGRDIRPEKPHYRAKSALMVKTGVVNAAFRAPSVECGLVLPQRNADRDPSGQNVAPAFTM